MQRLFVSSLILRANNTPQGSITTKQTLSYRQCLSEDEALGVVIRVTMQAYPDWSVQGYVMQEIPPEHVAVVFKAQEGQWTPEPLPVEEDAAAAILKENIERDKNEQRTAPDGV